MSVAADALVLRLADETIVPLEEAEWDAVASEFEELDRHSTFISGDLLIVRLESTVAAVEQPAPGKRVIRRLADLEAARRFTDSRLAEYERMWDGCGCKIDYYS